MNQAIQASKERKENRLEDIMTPAMEGVEPQEFLDLLAQEASPSLDHQGLRGHLVNQEEAMMDHQGRQGHLDLQEDPQLEFTGAHRLSIFLDHRDHLEYLDYLDTHQG